MNLTICSVSYNSSTEILNNFALTQRMNDQQPPCWIVADNSPADSSERLMSPPDGMMVIPGIDARNTPHYQHTLALAETIKLARTRFILVLDPDFFIVRKNWSMDMIEHLRGHQLDFMGVPWHPQRTDKYRYFPAVHCAMFDTQRFDQGAIDFLPDFPNGENDPLWPNGYREEDNYYCVNPLTRFLTNLGLFSARKKYYLDTGSRLYKRFASDNTVKFELIPPVFDPTRHATTLTWQTRLLERLLPDELCYVPKHYANNKSLSFLHQLLEGDIPENWEEFIWRELPFGFHMRRNAKSDSRSQALEREQAQQALRSLERLHLD